MPKPIPSRFIRMTDEGHHRCCIHPYLAPRPRHVIHGTGPSARRLSIPAGASHRVSRGAGYAHPMKGVAMTKYLCLYRGPATPMEDFTPEQSAEQTKAWGEWMGRVGSALVDPGAPFAERTAVVDNGSRTSRATRTANRCGSGEPRRGAIAVRRAPVPGRREGPVQRRGLRARANADVGRPRGCGATLAVRRGRVPPAVPVFGCGTTRTIMVGLSTVDE